MLALFMILFCSSLLALVAIKIYGVYLCFKKKWYIGLAALVIPFFADIIAVAKLVFKKDLLKL